MIISGTCKNTAVTQLLMLCLLVLSNYSFAQVIDPKNVDPTLLTELLYKKTDLLRKAEHCTKLKQQVTLEQAAKDHAKFLSRGQKLTHFQPSRSKRTPQMR